MAPNLFLCARAIFCPTYWFQKGDRDSNLKEQHWESPVPGTYKFLPGRGWHLVHRDGCENDEKFPAALVYCRILHRYMFESELEERCRWFDAPLHRGAVRKSCAFSSSTTAFTGSLAGTPREASFLALTPSGGSMKMDTPCTAVPRLPPVPTCPVAAVSSLVNLTEHLTSSNHNS
ncbi:hypothetical protein N7471_005604 [Penicillium samsonianum]|uniref:uncharacterized protein n=1 Tax=Penicillium samsonianum TaxID=1882272 RepID=UPI0025467C93|nr:uncharacterized protein N7471_005604 [Penicillium samsonianum]KAJ6139118.1 hypothetical protein N7471_005604 [Penicillium samsonianum]